MKHTFRYIITALLATIWFSGSLQAQHSKTHKHKHPSEYSPSCPLIDSIIEFSKTKLGARYASGGAGPNSFDCSGFMYYTFSHFNIQLGRSSRDQFQMGRKIEKKDIQPGDLVFWYRGNGYIGHVGMVVSVDSAHNFVFIHSATHGKGVRYDSSTGNWYSSTYAGARRIIECDGNGHAMLIKSDGNTTPQTNTQPIVEQNITTSTPSDTVTKAKPEQEVIKTTTPPVPAKPKVVYHKIKSGETLTSIAKKYHVTVKQIKQWNHLKSDMIRAGEKLKIISK